MKIPFNRPYMSKKGLEYIAQAHANGHLSGNGPFSGKCQTWLEDRIGCKKALLTHSCTAALEVAAILIDVQPGDEIIMPSYTFVSTANAFVLRGGIPVFVDIRPDTLNIDEKKIEAVITRRTKAIVPVHYAGVSCEMDTIIAVSKKHDLFVIEDAAQGIMSSYKGKPLGSIGHLAALSFHETKNIISGEGGALLVNNITFSNLAEIVCEKGTDRGRFFRGEIDKYTWQSIGSSYLPGELTSAFLWAQMEEADRITAERRALWQRYNQLLEPLEAAGKMRRPIIPVECGHNAHMYYILLPSEKVRNNVIYHLRNKGINAVFHYVPLHSSPAGKLFGRVVDNLLTTNDIANRLLRLPLWLGLPEHCQDLVVNSLKEIL